MKLLPAVFLLGCFSISGCSAATAPTSASPANSGTVANSSTAQKPVAAAPAAMPAAADQAAIRKSVTTLSPHAKIDSLRTTPIAGLSEVTIDGHLLYMTNDGKFVVSGNIIAVDGKVDLTEQARSAARRDAFSAITPAQTIVFAPAHPKYTVNVFTDVDCAYCRKLHSQIADYNNEGIAIRYLFFPRAGIGSESFNKAVAVWCAADRRRALTDAKAGLPVEMKTCTNPVTMDYHLGERIGVDGTPAIYTTDGVQIGGYISPVEMRHALEKLATKSGS